MKSYLKKLDYKRKIIKKSERYFNDPLYLQMPEIFLQELNQDKAQQPLVLEIY